MPEPWTSLGAPVPPDEADETQVRVFESVAESTALHLGPRLRGQGRMQNRAGLSSFVQQPWLGNRRGAGPGEERGDRNPH